MLFKHPFVEFCIKPFLVKYIERLLLTGVVVVHPSYGLSLYWALKLLSHVAFDREMTRIKMVVANRVKDHLQFFVPNLFATRIL